MAPTTVTIGYSKPGTEPPIYLAGSFSDPAWHPQEMEYTITEAGEHDFHKEVQVEEGQEYQYKFKIGEGDWWILNEDSPTVTDDIGNRNNLLRVPKPEDSKDTMEHEKQIQETPALEENDLATATEETMKNPTLAIAQTHQHEATEITPAVEPIDPMSVAKPATEKTQAEDIEELKEDLQDGSLVRGEDNNEDETLDLNTLHPEFPGEPTPTPATDIATPNPESAAAEEERAASTEMAHDLALPTLIIEKTDLSPHHGDDFGPNAAFAQQEAHDASALDATPDYVLLRNQSHTPDFVATASEVADIAATLDREAPTPPISDEEAGIIGYRRMSQTPIPEVAATASEVADIAATLDREATTPPISDEEAGRIGYRRISHTPIPEVAATAAEVADVAASLDGSFLPLIIEPSAFDLKKEEAIDSGRSTPANEKVPRFSHECCELPDRIEPCQHEPIEPLPEERSSHEDSSEEIDFNDPSIQMFPTERNEILAKLREIQRRLPEDETRVDGVPPSPVVGPNYHSNSNDRLHTPSPGMRAEERTSSLNSISEEVERGDFLFLTDGSPNGSRKLTSLSEPEEAVVNGNHVNGRVQESVAHQEEIHLPVPSQEETTAISENQPIAEQENRGRSRPAIPVTESARNPEETSTSQIPQRHEVSLMSDGSADDNKTMKLPEEQHRVEVQEVHPETPSSKSSTRSPNRNMRLAGLSEKNEPAVTPFVVGDRQLGQNEEEVQNIETGSGPNINVLPATPGGSSTKTDKTTILDDSGKTTAVPNEMEARNRKQPVPERPLTPSSMRSAGKEAKERNFLKAFWRVVFVDWIGGLIMRLCGGARRRQKTLLAVIGIAVLAVVPTLYFSEPAREVALQAWSDVSDETMKYWQEWRGRFEMWRSLH